MDRHPKRLQKKARTHAVTQVTEDAWDVVSASSGETYRVAIDEGLLVCDCTWSAEYHPKGEPCSHILAVERHRERDAKDRTLAFWASKSDARRQHRPIIPVSGGLWATSRAPGT